MGTASKNFDFSEFEVTNCPELAEKNRIDSLEILENVKALVDNVLQPLRDALGAPVIVNSGYRCREVNERAGGVANSQHCFDEKTELLTLEGWKRYDEIKEGDLIYSYSIEKEVIEIVPIESIIIRHHKGRMMWIKNKQHDICVTDKHRMLVRYDNNKYIKKGNKKISPECQAYFDSLKTDNDKYHIETANEVFGKRRWYMSAGLYKSDKVKMKYSLTFIKFLLAVITDGCIHWDDGVFRGITFCLKKERKIKHIKDLMNGLGYYYSESQRSKDDVTRFDLCAKFSKEILEIIGEKKDIPKFFCELDSDLQKELLYEYAFYDGHFDEREGSTCVCISTTSEHNFNILQTMCVLSGMRVTTIFKDSTEYNIKGKKGKTKPVWKMNFSTKRSDARVNGDDYEWIDYDGIVWCANNRNTTLITRRNNFISIQGNCTGSAADIRTKSHTPFEIAYMATDIDIPYDQLILYNNFVHISHVRDGKQRKQFLDYRDK